MNENNRARQVLGAWRAHKAGIAICNSIIAIRDAFVNRKIADGMNSHLAIELRATLASDPEAYTSKGQFSRIGGAARFFLCITCSVCQKTHSQCPCITKDIVDFGSQLVYEQKGG